MRKGQAALEFLTTYGWAFIVILIMIGALAYFGVLNPSRALPTRCLVEAGFDCKDFKITNNTIDILIINRKGEGLTVNGVTVTSDAGDTGTCTVTGGLANQNITISCTVADFSASIGTKIKAEFAVNYTMARGTYSQKFEGSIFGPVQ